jgi:hypothetical protein
MESEKTGAERRKHPRRGCGYIIDYQLMQEETGMLSKRASTLNVSAEGLCICSPFQESPNDVLLLTMPYITPNPGIVAAKIKYTVKAQFEGYIHGLYILPLFQERFSVVDAISANIENLVIPLEPEELAALRDMAGEDGLVSPVVEGICRFWNDINPRIETPITSFEELTRFLSREIEKRNHSGR